jgi:hypothetical protein
MQQVFPDGLLKQGTKARSTGVLFTLDHPSRKLIRLFSERDSEGDGQFFDARLQGEEAWLCLTKPVRWYPMITNLLHGVLFCRIRPTSERLPGPYEGGVDPGECGKAARR